MSTIFTIIDAHVTGINDQNLIISVSKLAINDHDVTYKKAQ